MQAATGSFLQFLGAYLLEDRTLYLHTMFCIFNVHLLTQCWNSAHIISCHPPHPGADLLFFLIKNLVWNQSWDPSPKTLLNAQTWSLPGQVMACSDGTVRCCRLRENHFLSLGLTLEQGWTYTRWRELNRINGSRLDVRLWGELEAQRPFPRCTGGLKMEMVMDSVFA